TCSEDIGSLKDSLLGAEANVSDVWLLDVPMTAYSTSEKESFSMNSTTEDWDLYFNDLSLPLRDDSAPEVGPIESLNADTPTEVEPLTPSDHMADVAIPTEPCSPLGQDAFGDGELWWQPPTIDWDVGVGSTLLDANATIAGFESPGCSHEREQRLYVDRGSERLRSPSTKPMF
ncbi:hypothetical protein MMC18_007519, partial [Xylographa bjoerkii]|nr:hypothetical protein [Xylographa bjoerkii]